MRAIITCSFIQNGAGAGVTGDAASHRRLSVILRTGAAREIVTRRTPDGLEIRCNVAADEAGD
jgi:hypothetical protein